MRGVSLLPLVLAACQSTTGTGGLPLDRLDLPAGFAVDVWAEVPGARTLRAAPDGGKVFIGTRGDRILEAQDHDGDGRADAVIEHLRGLDVPTGLAVGADGALTVAERHRVVRIADGRATVVVPEGVLPVGALHPARYAGFGLDGRLYVSSSAPCNVCAVRGFEAAILSAAPDGGDLDVFARGVRDSHGFDWHPETGEMFFTDIGADYLGDHLPPDELNHAPHGGMTFGFPYTYGDNEPYPQFVDVEPPERGARPALLFGAHTAPQGIDFYEGAMFTRSYRHDAFVAQYGSWNRAEPVGYRVLRVRFEDGRPTGTEVFIDGWLDEDGRAWGRPVDLEELADGSLLISDDYAGVIYRVHYRDG